MASTLFFFGIFVSLLRSQISTTATRKGSGSTAAAAMSTHSGNCIRRIDVLKRPATPGGQPFAPLFADCEDFNEGRRNRLPRASPRRGSNLKGRWEATARVFYARCRREPVQIGFPKFPRFALAGIRPADFAAAAEFACPPVTWRLPAPPAWPLLPGSLRSARARRWGRARLRWRRLGED